MFYAALNIFYGSTILFNGLQNTFYGPKKAGPWTMVGGPENMRYGPWTTFYRPENPFCGPLTVFYGPYRECSVVHGLCCMIAPKTYSMFRGGCASLHRMGSIVHGTYFMIRQAFSLKFDRPPVRPSVCPCVRPPARPPPARRPPAARQPARPIL